MLEGCCNCTGCKTCDNGQCVNDDSECPTCKLCSGGNCLNAPVGTWCGDCKGCDGAGNCVYYCEGCESCVEGSYGIYHCEDDDSECTGDCEKCMSANCYCDMECCEGPCCGNTCCNEGELCCNGLTCYDPDTEKCCNDEEGNTCDLFETCCEGNCCNLSQCCVDGQCINEGDECSPGRECCNGNCCNNESCCDSSDCEHCDSGACEPCLQKASDYEELEGCSNIVDDPDQTPTPNGCGPEGWGHMVPDNPTGCEDTSFLGACNEHDNCYGSCGNNQDGCDSTFLNTMLDVCMGSSCAVLCSEFAYTYYGVVNNEGEPAWKSAQVSACSCCDC